MNEFVMFFLLELIEYWNIHGMWGNHVTFFPPKKRLKNHGWEIQIAMEAEKLEIPPNSLEPSLDLPHFCLHKLYDLCISPYWPYRFYHMALLTNNPLLGSQLTYIYISTENNINYTYCIYFFGQGFRRLLAHLQLQWLRQPHLLLP